GRLITFHCTPKCRSLQHGAEVVAALTAGSEGRLHAFLLAHCYNAATLRDAFGRSALHLAASMGQRALLEWLLESKGADILLKDKESGWTALHRSAFYGHIHCLLALVKHGGLLTTLDKEGLSVLDITMKDRPQHVVFRNTDPTEVYTWGNNTNFTLGHGNHESRHHPEIVDFFSRTGVYIKQVVLCKFHSVFLSQKGEVFTCGHGQGGRLGHGDEQTYLVPRVVEGLLSHHCSQVAAAKDHTVVLTEEGYVYTFGLNTFHQLGLTLPATSSHVPKQVFCKALKGRIVIGVAAGRFHTVLWTRDALYTMGLNGGQLGYLLDPNGEKCVTAPRQVSALHHKDVTIAMAAASNGATVCVTEKGDVYLLTDYQCKKLASRQLNIKKILVSGGSLDHRVDPQVLNEGGGDKVSILALDEAGRVFCWRSGSSSVKQCRWAYGRQVFMADIALSKNHMMFVTQEGEGFTGHWLTDHKRSAEKKGQTGHFEGGSLYERIRLVRIPFIHRAVSITIDSKGRNFGVLQSDPKTSLYEVPSVSASSFSQHFRCLLAEADEADSIHDVMLQTGNRSYPVHKYILSSRSEFFRKQLSPEAGRGDEENQQEVGVTWSEDAVGCDLMVLEKVPADMLEYVLQFLYTDSCQMLEQGFRPGILNQEQPAEPSPEQLICSLQGLGFCGGLKGCSALEVYQSLPASALEGSKQKSRTSKTCKKSKGKEAGEGGANPVKILQGVAKKLGISSLVARLDGVRYENGRINVLHKKTGNKLKFNPKKCLYLCDVTLQSEDGKDFPCHKCVLCARLEYFHSMLGSSWSEASCCTALVMPATAEVLQVILEYIYTDESPTVRESQNVEFVCNVLVMADQLLIPRLKEICEVSIAENLTLKNAAELLEFAAMYNSQQLKLSCLQFIGLNMAALLEARTLDILSIDMQMELSAAYRRMIPAMQKRLITPNPDAPDLSVYEDEDWDSSPHSENGHWYDLPYSKMKAKRKPRRRSDSSGGYNLSDIIQSPPTSGLVKSAKTNSIESLQELLTSDSEGSCVGVGSPRDLCSPVFQERLEVLEEKARVTGLKNPHQVSNVNPTGILPVRSPPPEPAPGPHTRWHPPVLDLRTIMEMEAHLQNLGATPKSFGSGNRYVSKSSAPPPKLSQRQRKMIAMATKGACMDGVTVKSPPPVTTSKMGRAWGTPAQASSSFREVMREEEKDQVRSEAEVLGDSSSSVRKVTFSSPPTSHVERLSGPWLWGAAGSPPQGTTVTFASIVEEERQQEAALIRSRDKPLALIQVEERAIQELLFHYKAPNNPEEFILVERASLGPIATPTWNKH
uniref:Inhibitor of Bruton tyrosine kinase n=1 Tax=Scleropages formosus TaxID=113540 RepID=A0A8C9SNX1_SCLFO